MELTARSVEGLLDELWQHLPRGARRIVREAHPRLYVDEAGVLIGPDRMIFNSYASYFEEPVVGSVVFDIIPDDGSVAWRRGVRGVLLEVLVNTVTRDLVPAPKFRDKKRGRQFKATADAIATAWGLGKIWRLDPRVPTNGRHLVWGYHVLSEIPSRPCPG
jgi:hypothetical protein